MDKKTLLYNVTDLFLKYGIKNVTTDFISQKLGISKKTLYEFFTSKEKLIEEVIKIIISDEFGKNKFNKNFKSIDKLNAIEVNLMVLNHILEINKNFNPIFFIELKKYYPHLYKKLENHKKVVLKEKILNNLKKGKKEGLYRNNLNEEIIASFYLSFVELFTPENFENVFGTKYSKQEVIKEIFLFHMYAITSSKGKKFLSKILKKYNL